MENPTTDIGSIPNVSSDNQNGRAVADSLAVFAEPVPIPPGVFLMGSGRVSLLVIRRKREKRLIPPAE
jgi:hypothetical protein